MRICLLCEGSYPYIAGGVASWVQTFIREFKDCEFILFCIATNRKEMGRYRYELPSNVTEVRTVYLSEPEPEHWKKLYFNPRERAILEEIISGDLRGTDWKEKAGFLHRYRDNIQGILNSESFYEISLKQYQENGENSVFSHYLWNMRGMFQPFFKVACAEIPEADLYHSVSAGYAGLAATIFSSVMDRPFILSEHGIYTREREEDIIRATWLEGEYKEMWIGFFKRLSLMAYDRAVAVTTLFDGNGDLQAGLGCPEEKIRRIPNGIDPDDISLLHERTEESKKYYNFGAVLRVVPIKDLKTMIIAFSQVRKKVENARLHIYGNFDEAPDYYNECVNLIHNMQIPDIIFYGQVNIREYLHDIDMMLLTSISEGQPLTILEGFALEIPCIATNVGGCSELILGKEGDKLGPAGFIVPVMNVAELVNAMLYAVDHPEEMRGMGRTGKKRVQTFYTKKLYLNQYREIYKEVLLKEESPKTQGEKLLKPESGRKKGLIRRITENGRNWIRTKKNL